MHITHSHRHHRNAHRIIYPPYKTLSAAMGTSPTSQPWILSAQQRVSPASSPFAAKSPASCTPLSKPSATPPKLPPACSRAQTECGCYLSSSKLLLSGLVPNSASSLMVPESCAVRQQSRHFPLSSRKLSKNRRDGGLHGLIFGRR